MSDTEKPDPRPGIRVLGQPGPTEPAGDEAGTEPAGDEAGTAPVGDDAAAPVGDDAAAPAEGADGSGRTVRPGVLVGLVLVALLGVIGTVAFGLLWAHDQSRQSGAKSVQSASRAVAQRFLTDFTTFGPSTVAQTFTNIQALSTGSFASQARAEFSPSLRQQLQAANASTAGQIRYLELQSYTANSASYFADVVQTFSNNKTNGPQSDELRLVVDLRLVGGRWKVSGVTSLDNPAASGG